MIVNSNTLLDLELQLTRGGWDLETQHTIFEYLKGKPKRFESPEARRIADEAKSNARIP